MLFLKEFHIHTYPKVLHNHGWIYQFLDSLELKLLCRTIIWFLMSFVNILLWRYNKWFKTMLKTAKVLENNM